MDDRIDDILSFHDQILRMRLINVVKTKIWKQGLHEEGQSLFHNFIVILDMY